ncbi:hypothetical protein, partial [Halorubrum trueperi]
AQSQPQQATAQSQPQQATAQSQPTPTLSAQQPVSEPMPVQGQATASPTQTEPMVSGGTADQQAGAEQQFRTPQQSQLGGSGPDTRWSH